DPSEARGNQVTAREILDKGRAEIETGLAGQPEVQARLMGTMGNVYTNLGLLKEARPLIEKSLTSSTSRLGSAHPDTLALRRDLADLTKLEGKLGEAETQLVALLADDRATLGEKHSETLRAATLLSGVYLDEGKYSAAEQLISSSLAASRETGDTQSELN